MSHQMDRYHYETEGGKYNLGIIAEQRSGRWYVIFADLYSEDGVFKGTWMRAQMPFKLIREIQAWCIYAHSLGIPLDGTDWLDT